MESNVRIGDLKALAKLLRSVKTDRRGNSSLSGRNIFLVERCPVEIFTNHISFESALSTDNKNNYKKA